MTKNFLLTRPSHDVITSYLHDFSKDIVKKAKAEKSMYVTDLEGAEAVRKNLENSITKENPQLIFLNGHGDRKTVLGHKDEVILDLNNAKLTKDKIVYALSCDSLEMLGKISVEKGAKAYIGYKESFMMVCDPSRESTPGKDKNALPFKKVCDILINSLVFGSKVSQAIERTKNEYRHLIRSYGTSEDDPYGDTPLIRFALAWNMKYLDIEGDPSASF
jgi:hypothetical protein